MRQSVKELVADILGLDSEDLPDDFSRETADNWDSLNHLRIITAVEQAFAISLTMIEIENVTSVRDLSNIVHARSQSS